MWKRGKRGEGAGGGYWGCYENPFKSPLYSPGVIGEVSPHHGATQPESSPSSDQDFERRANKRVGPYDADPTTHPCKKHVGPDQPGATQPESSRSSGEAAGCQKLRSSLATSPFRCSKIPKYAAHCLMEASAVSENTKFKGDDHDDADEVAEVCRIEAYSPSSDISFRHHCESADETDSDWVRDSGEMKELAPRTVSRRPSAARVKPAKKRRRDGSFSIDELGKAAPFGSRRRRRTEKRYTDGDTSLDFTYDREHLHTSDESEAHGVQQPDTSQAAINDNLS